MILFYSSDIVNGVVCLDKNESAHCVRVLRHKVGDEISVIDGRGSLYKCRLSMADPKASQAVVIEEVKGFGGHDYRLTMAVCPTKNLDRYEWFVEKATEFGVDTFVPIIGRFSERKELKTERLKRVVLSAAKQSLKASLPEVLEPVSIIEFLRGFDSNAEVLKLICCCFEPEGGRKAITALLETAPAGMPVAVLIGPEGDFSQEELQLAIELGWTPVSLGDSRLRTETAAVAAVAAVYFSAIR